MRPRWSSGAKTALRSADDDAGSAGADVLPLVVAFAAGEMAVEDGDADFLADEAGAEVLDGLGREGDLGDEDEGGFAQR